MKLNTKSRMAISAILDVAVHGAEKPVALASIAERQDISQSYLEQLFRLLREQGFIKSSRGPGGGYRMGKRLAAISAADIVEAVNHNPGRMRSCRSKGDCRDGGSCQAHGLWCRVNDHLRNYLRTVTLESLLQDTAGAGEVAPAFADDARGRRENRRLSAVA